MTAPIRVPAAPSMFRRFVECAAFAVLAACVGSGMRTRGANPATRTALTEYPVASSEPLASGEEAEVVTTVASN